MLNMIIMADKLKEWTTLIMDIPKITPILIHISMNTIKHTQKDTK